MAEKQSLYTLPPDQPPLPKTPRERFARTLRALIYKKGFVYFTDFCRAVERELGSEFGRQTLNSYLGGRNWPQQPRLMAMAKVLKVQPEDLIPREDWGNVEGMLSTPEARAEGEARSFAHGEPRPPFTMVQEGDKFRLRIDILTDFDTAMQISQLAMKK